MLHFDQFEIVGSIPVHFAERQRELLRFPTPIPSCEWMEKHFVVTKGPFKGPFRFVTTPYLRGPFEAFDDPDINKIDLMFPPQRGKTVFEIGCASISAHQNPVPIMFVLPTEALAKALLNRRIIPTFQSIPLIRDLMTDKKKDVSSIGIFLKNGFELILGWASSATSLSSETMCYIFGDEVAKWAAVAGNELSPKDLTESRQPVWGSMAKSIDISTPNEIGDIFDQSVQSCDELRQWWITCPKCGAEQLPEFGDPTTIYGIKIPEKIKDPKKVINRNLARYICKNCFFEIDSYEFRKAALNGFYHAEKKATGKIRSVAFHIYSWVTPFSTLNDAAAAKLKSDADEHLRGKSFKTQHAAEPWQDIIIETTEEELLKAVAADLPPQTVPDAAIALTAGIDVQKTGFYHVVRAWARDYTSWLIDYGFLPKWEDVFRLLFETYYPHPRTGLKIRIAQAALDTGGGKYENMSDSMTEETYWWIRDHGVGYGARVWATKGASRRQASKVQLGKVLDKTPSGKPIPGGLQLIFLDTDQLNDSFFHRIGWAKEGLPKGSYLNNYFLQKDEFGKNKGRDYIKHIMAERKQRNKKTGLLGWERIHRRNDYLDCERMAHACAEPEFPGGAIHLYPDLVPPAPVSRHKKKKRTERESAW